MRIFIVVNRFPPLHAGTFDFQCEAVRELLRKRGLAGAQRDPEIERRRILQGTFGAPPVTGSESSMPGRIEAYLQTTLEVWQNSAP